MQSSKDAVSGRPAEPRLSFRCWQGQVPAACGAPSLLLLGAGSPLSPHVPGTFRNGFSAVQAAETEALPPAPWPGGRRRALAGGAPGAQAGAPGAAPAGGHRGLPPRGLRQPGATKPLPAGKAQRRRKELLGREKWHFPPKYANRRADPLPLPWREERYRGGGGRRRGPGGRWLGGGLRGAFLTLPLP